MIVPGVVGLPVGTAGPVLTESGLSPGMAAIHQRPARPGGRQSPGPGSSLPRGSYITLVVGRRT